MMKKIIQEKGSVTLFVLIACMFMIMVLLMVNIAVMNRNRSQERELEEIAKEYNQNEIDLDNAYAKVVGENDYATVSEITNIIYPVGSIYITTNNQNPSEYLGGEWESFGEGRTIVGAGTGTDENNVQKVFEIEQTGGEYEHKLIVAEMPSHTHQLTKATGAGSLTGNAVVPPHNGISAGATVGPAPTGGDQPHNNVQPYIVTYMWKRIA